MMRDARCEMKRFCIRTKTLGYVFGCRTPHGHVTWTVLVDSFLDKCESSYVDVFAVGIVCTARI
jgi:hypothetical protein